MYVFDVEIFKNFFSVTFYNPQTKEAKAFVIHSSRDESESLYNFIDQELALVGFNCVDFDTPILQFFYDNWDDKKITSKLYNYAQKLIKQERSYYHKVRWEQRDLFRIWHFDNLAKTTSLKRLQINMGFKNVMDMPIEHTAKITADQIPMILEYNLNDVMATHELYIRSKGKIRLRKKLGEKYGMDMGNFNDPKIGEYIILKMLSDKTGTSIDALKKCRTPRKEVRLADVILPEVKFKSKFQDVYEKFKQTTVVENGDVDYCCNFDGVDYYFGLGGIHACRGGGIYSNISSCDVVGYYPALAVSKSFSPAHFGIYFTEVYKQIAIERAGFERGSDDNIALKLAQNGTFGKSNSQYSPFYDPKMFYQITINGQLLLAMLCEEITLSGAGKIILANTDGIEVDVIDQDVYDEVCGGWEKLIGLKLEHSIYKTLVVRDINNYLAIKPNGKTKEKGVFVCEPDLEKNHSQLAVPIAIRNYFSLSIPIADTIRGVPIDKLLIGQRAKKGKFYLRSIDGSRDSDLQKNIRYYITTSGEYLRKRTDKTDGGKHIGYKVKMFNTWGEAKDIDYDYYINEVNKVMDTFKSDLTLW